MAEVTKRLNYTVRFLRRHFKDLGASISAHYLSYQKKLPTNSVKQSCLLVQQTALEIYIEGEPTRSGDSSRLNKPTDFR